MKNDVILTEQTIRLKARIRDIDGSLVQPQSIEFELKKPDEAEYTAYTIISNPRIINESTGVYYIDIDVDIPGRYEYSWFTYGSPHTSAKSYFEAQDARYL